MKKISLTLAPGAHLGVGLMSGTSHDGISAALAEIDERKRPSARVLAFHSYHYEPEFQARLLEASAGADVGAQRISSLNFELGNAFGRAATELLKASRISARRISFIGSHGHTFAHVPPRRGKPGAGSGFSPSTLQLGETALIAAITRIPVVADFRPMDIALGGQGAPLAPLAHIWFFADPKRGRIIQNIGGIGNATWLGPARSRERIRPVAFDTGPGVMLI
ncbi:MAG: anhydro-N-acetylmuramic acid kinase, partial [Candidatus Binataceae bacterium]